MGGRSPQLWVMPPHNSRPDGSLDSCCFGCCAKCNDCRYFKKATVDDMLSKVKPGDVILFENKCRFGSCCIACWSRSDFDHVGLVYHGASTMSALLHNSQQNCKEYVNVEIECPHIVEALAPHVVAGPLQVVASQVIGDGGQIFWRPLHRPEMDGEPAAAEGKPVIPKLMYKSEDAAKQRDKITMPGKYRHDDVVTEPVPLSELSDNAKGVKGTKIKDVAVPVIDAESEEGQTYAAKIRDYETVPIKDGVIRRLKSPLNYREFNHSCAKLAGTPYEERGIDMVNTAIVQDNDCWAACFGDCCCERNQKDDARTEEEKMKTEESLFCSELAALQFLRAGWREGRDMSDMYMPKDFSDDPHEQLSQDLKPEVYLGEPVKIYLDAKQMDADEAAEDEEDRRRHLARSLQWEQPVSNAEAASSHNESSALLQNR